MTASEGASSNIVGVRDVYDIVSRLETKFDSQVQTIEGKIDDVTGRMNRIEGAISVFKWLGPVGIAGLIFGILKGAGYL